MHEKYLRFPDFFAVREALFGSSSRYPSDLNKNTITVSKVLISELYLVNPCEAEQKTLIVLLADNPFAGSLQLPLV
ncbi:hypothetical protein E3N88_24080 [Mikania micrantha]|uniref:Uncharacterized protein n=1 Tax=Mikania micrantha TaxID=192012 RepID=A0A5N6NG67_9ASTR|nr:hypothetical protein E3N88_24080 [Mikania micrantha]